MRSPLIYRRARPEIQQGVSAPAVPRGRLTVDRLAEGIRRLVRDTALRERAARFGETIRAEQGVANAVRMIEQSAKG